MKKYIIISFKIIIIYIFIYDCIEYLKNVWLYLKYYTPYYKMYDHANTLTNEDLQYAGITPLQACIKKKKDPFIFIPVFIYNYFKMKTCGA